MSLLRAYIFAVLQVTLLLLLLLSLLLTVLNRAISFATITIDACVIAAEKVSGRSVNDELTTASTKTVYDCF